MALRGQVRALLGDAQGALAWFQSALRQNPREPFAQVVLSDLQGAPNAARARVEALEAEIAERRICVAFVSQATASSFFPMAR